MHVKMIAFYEKAIKQTYNCMANKVGINSALYTALHAQPFGLNFIIRRLAAKIIILKLQKGKKKSAVTGRLSFSVLDR